MVRPLVPGAVAHGDAADGELAQRRGQRGPRAHGAEERVPPVGYLRAVQEGQVQRLQGPRGAAGGYAGDDGGVGGRGRWWGVGDVGEAHFGWMGLGKGGGGGLLVGINGMR